MRLYRAVSPQELADIQFCGRLRPGPNSLAGKWFAERASHAETWGHRLYVALPFHVIEVEVAERVADQWYRVPRLDNIGPSRYAEEADLLLITLVGEVPLSTGGP